MSEFSNEQEYQPTARPTFLVVLAVLSFISMGLNFLQYLFSLISGPMNQDAWEVYEATMYESVGQMNDLGMDGFAKTIEQVIQMSYMANFDYFVANNVLQIVSVVIGAVGVILMLRLKRMGFHLYVIYSLSPIIIMYLLFPAAVISTFAVVTTLIFSALFCILYAFNLKHMK